MRMKAELRTKLGAMLKSSTPGRWWDAPAALLLLAVPVFAEQFLLKSMLDKESQICFI